MKDNIIAEKPLPQTRAQLDLRKLGLEEVAYVKSYLVQGKQPAWVLHAADGTALAVQKTPEAARDSARHQNLALVSLH